MVQAPLAMPHGYPSNTHQRNLYHPYTGPQGTSTTTGQKLYHADYDRMENQNSLRHQWHSRPPPPNYNINYQHSSPSSPTMRGVNDGVNSDEGNTNTSSDCMCTSCTRPPQYHPPSLPHSSTLPHYSQPQSWTPPPPSHLHQQHQLHQPQQQHQQQQHFNTSSQHGQQQNDFQPNASWSPGMTTMTAYERTNNEPSMVSTSRYGQLGDSNRYSSMHDSTRYSPVIDTRHLNLRDIMPLDPREWTAHDVQRWVQWACMAFKLKVIPQDRFQMNGKALCLMDLSMFMFRVPDGGERLYDDFQTRLKKALSHDQPPKSL